MDKQPVNLAFSLSSQTHSFTTILVIEMWERFGYYGMQVLIVYYMVQQLGFSDQQANLSWSICVALIYTTPVIGGWVGDKVLGTRRTLLLGVVILVIGYGLIAIPKQDTDFMFLALGVIIVGNGLFKPNASNMIRKIYQQDNSKIESAFTLYYMSVNIGSMISMLLIPWVKDYINDYFHSDFGWYIAFSISAIGLILGLSYFFMMHQSIAHIGSYPDFQPIKLDRLSLVFIGSIIFIFFSAFVIKNEYIARWFIYITGISVLLFFIFLMATNQGKERYGLIITFLLTLQIVFFFIFYQQMATSLALFILRNVDWGFYIFGIHLFNWAPAQFQALNPIWIFILSPLLAWSYIYTNQKNNSIATKFIIGFIAMAASFFVYSIAVHFSNTEGRISSWFIVWGYGFGALSELLISGLGLAVIARYTPDQIGGLMMGVYFIVTGISQYFGGWVATLAAIPKNIIDPQITLLIYTNLFNWLCIAATICALVALVLLQVIKKFQFKLQNIDSYENK
ncbi:peptide MFS transporter [Candidatus Nitrosacidococcus sp. I8]|uniref:peptide MFS transporter n=1 Tax=Candidatus Nitrosacidococcus sp. I8 TaxID=2942908 RepID=UPI002226D803|nr:oligopeptide:H+ symporter [Candidatus Nitrosacidococcus sp. I8]CAH9018879.1 Dipeptide and tripeptide permease A [Candidatus Nitrosacidococcus sp. I8]